MVLQPTVESLFTAYQQGYVSSRDKLTFVIVDNTVFFKPGFICNVVAAHITQKPAKMKEALKSHMYWPLLFFILLFFGFFACYGISLSYQHVVSPPEWPFVSDTGARSPESTLFSLILSLASFMVLITMYLYYKYVIHHHHPTKLNTAAFVIGCIASFGVVLVGAFQWTVLLIPHLIGAFTAFIGAMIYGWLIVIISWRQLVPHVHGMAIVYCRLALVILGSAAIIIMIIFASLMQVDARYSSTAAITEWILIYAAVFFLATLIYDLRRIKSAEVKLVLHGDHA